MGEITIFKDSVTEDGLKIIQERQLLLPKIIENKQHFVLIYNEYQNARKLRIAINKKSVELIKEKKIAFDITKSLIQDEEKRILDIISPLETKLKTIRETWEESERIKTEKKSAEIAEKQKAEFIRQEILRVYDQAVIENAEFDQKIKDDNTRRLESHRLREESERLKRLEEVLNKRDKELELREKERMEEFKVAIKSETVSGQLEEIETVNEMLGEQEEKVIFDGTETVNEINEILGTVPAREELSEEEQTGLYKLSIVPSKPEEKTVEPVVPSFVCHDLEGEVVDAEDEEFEYICPKCGFQFSVEEGV